jgi:hypothetical protein
MYYLDSGKKSYQKWLTIANIQDSNPTSEWPTCIPIELGLSDNNSIIPDSKENINLKS